jgi:tetratricopeptide (TPR) repeat protein
MLRRISRWLAGTPPEEGAGATGVSGPADAGSPVPVPAAPQADWLAQGNAALGRGATREALECYRRATEADAGNPLAWLNHGFASLQLGQGPRARESLQRALLLAKPQDAFVHEVHYLIGSAWAGEGRPDEAEAAWRVALALRPDFIEARAALAELLVRQERADEALACTEETRGSVALATTRAQALFQLRRHEESLALLDAVLAHQPGHVAALDGRGNVLLELDRLDEALASFRHAAELAGPDADRLANFSSALHRMGRLQEALASADEAVRLVPGHARARWNRSLVLLLLGDLEAAWPDFEVRDARAGAVPSPAPRWRGEDLRGLTVLIDHEQGLGDVIQFLRYVPLVAARARSVALRVPGPLTTLATGLAPNCTVIGPGDPAPRVDAQCSVMSLPALFGTSLATIPAPAAYLAADSRRTAAWAGRLAGAANGRLRVGIVWSGNPAHLNDRNRSIPLEQFRHVGGPECLFVILQPEVRERDQPALHAWPGLLAAGPEMRDFADTAALISALDLVISVDTSVAHLAGALGKPVWILLPAMPDWRWLLDRADSPWYPTARLYRQPAPGDWAAVLRQVKGDLAWFAGAAAPPSLLENDRPGV